VDLASRELAILDPMWLFCGGAKPEFAIGFVFRIVALKPGDMAVTLK
jgi:hypothetical protein